ncbi:hypothetical protein KC19_10G164500 [Ceratodon purpureus]|uniref:Cytochrome P450 n=1 Tax=Ceratodon purpureus TaxID=3225 RepID=A0A8T0GTD3_CERPU|nr:hypothetical protein KC19_10G164500 [Ceratodon purpureus]
MKSEPGWSFQYHSMSHLIGMSAGPILVALAIGGFVTWLWWYGQAQRNTQGPKRWPLIGSTIEIVLNWDRLHDWMLEQFSDTKTFHLATMATVSPLPSIFTVDPANVEYILKTNFSNYPKGYVHCERLRELFGMGIFAVDGHLWKEQRRVTSYEFSSAALRDFSTVVFREYASKLVSILARFASTAEEFDLQDLCMRMTLDTTSKIGFGVELHCLSPSLPTVPFAKCFDDANYISFYRFGDPLWRLKRMLNIGIERKLKECIKVMDDFTFDVIDKRRKDMAAFTNQPKQSDLLSRFIDLCTDDGGISIYTDKDLRDMILNFLVAGRDTTAVTLSWFFYMMTCHPEVANKIVDELSTVAQSPAQHTGEVTEETIVEFSKLLTYETLGKLHYLHAALSETLRLYPAVPIEGKEAAEDDVLPDGTFVKKGSHTGYVPYSMGRMKFLWGDDAMIFKPERWLENGLYQPQPLFKFSAFQAGPRTCLGKDSAYLQMKMTAALVLRFFALHLVPGHPIHYRTMIVLNLQHGLRVTAMPPSSVHSSPNTLE